MSRSRKAIFRVGSGGGRARHSQEIKPATMMSAPKLPETCLPATTNTLFRDETWLGGQLSKGRQTPSVWERKPPPTVSPGASKELCHGVQKQG